MDVFCGKLKSMPEIQTTVAALKAKVEEHADILEATKYSWSLEVCPRTLVEQDEVQLHCHVVLEWVWNRHEIHHIKQTVERDGWKV